MKNFGNVSGFCGINCFASVRLLFGSRSDFFENFSIRHVLAKGSKYFVASDSPLYTEEGPGTPPLVDRRGAHRPRIDHFLDRHRSRFLPSTFQPIATVRMTASVWGLRVRGGAKHYHLETQGALAGRCTVLLSSVCNGNLCK